MHAGETQYYYPIATNNPVPVVSALLRRLRWWRHPSDAVYRTVTVRRLPMS